MRNNTQRYPYRHERDDEGRNANSFYNRRHDEEERDFEDRDDFFDADDNAYEDRYSPRQYSDDFADEEFSNNYDDDDEFDRLTGHGRRGYENLGRNYERGTLNEGKPVRSNRPMRHSSSGLEIGSGFAARGGDHARRFASLGGKTSHVSERNQRGNNQNRTNTRNQSGRNRH